MPDDPIPSLAQIVAALCETYDDAGVIAWLTSGHLPSLTTTGGFTSAATLLRQGKYREVADLVRAIGDADPSDYTVTRHD